MKLPKFRGLKSTGNGYAFGEITTFMGHPQICCDTEQGWKVDNVDERTIRQFATTDSNGKEVYAGDTVIADGELYKVKILPVFINEDDDTILIDAPEHFRLKERDNR